MKKLLLALMMILSVSIFAQNEQFTKNYTRYGIKKSNDTEFSLRSGKSSVIFNVNGSNRITVNVYQRGFTFVTVSTPKRMESGSQSYQYISIVDNNDNEGTLILFDDQTFGCMFVFKEMSIALF